VTTTLLRSTLHLVAHDEYPAYAQLVRQARMRTWRRKYDHLDEAQLSAELRRWLREPRTNDEIRERVGRIEGVPQTTWGPVDFIRTLLPLVQLAPAGHWSDRRRPRFAADPRRLPSPAHAARDTVRRYLAAFGPATRADAASWAGVAQRDLATGFEARELVRFQDDSGRELFDLPAAPRPPAGTHLPVRLLANWDQALLAHADRERIIPSALLVHALTITGDPTVTVDGRVAAKWRVEREGDLAMLSVAPLADFSRSARAELREEAERTVRLCEPTAERVIVCFE
jgi:winged helix DNA-binding protein